MMSITRPSSISVGEIELTLPVFFPSISSVKTAMPPIQYAELLSSLASINGQFLISAFDIWQANEEDQIALIGFLNKARDNGATVLMDSGNYESYWKNKMAEWQQSDFHDVLGQHPCSLAFSFDEQFPPFEIDAHVKLVVNRWKLDQAAAGTQPIIPIVHGEAIELPRLAASVAEATGVSMIAVPERRLGSGIFERAKSVRAIREELDSSGRYIALHLLGTGNPISIALYALAGADSFDGLEWCQTVVDHETALLSHLTHADFFRAQTEWGDGDLSFQARTLAHNLEFYLDWMNKLRGALVAGKAIDFCRAHFPARVYVQCAAEFCWEDVT